jgi:hypothetical protein
MAFVIGSPRFSFVQFGTGPSTENNFCDWDVRYCLPVAEEDDIAFQVLVTASTIAEADALCSGITAVFGLSDTVGGAFSLILAGVPEVDRVSDTQLVIMWPEGMPGFKGVYDIGDCFVMRLDVTIGPTTVSAWSNCFERIASNDCYTSVLEYGGRSNEYGFIYCNTDDDVPGGGGGVVTSTFDYSLNFSITG